MKGRIENQIKTENSISIILKGCPKYLEEYYYSIMSFKEPKTCRVCIYAIKKFLMFLNDDMNSIDISSITNVDVAKYLHSIEVLKSGNGNSVKYASASYVNSTHSHLKDFFNFLQSNEYIKDNPMDQIKRIKRKDIVKRPKLTERDLRKILKSVDNGVGTDRAITCQQKWKTRDKAILLLFLNTGMRETALTEINLDEPDFENNKLSVIDKRHSEHTYFLGETLKQALLDWIEDREWILNGKECDALFISSRGTRITARAVQDIVSKYSEDALGYKISPHKLRAAFCTILYERKGDIEFVRDAVGHSNVSVTQRYIVKDDLQKKEASQIMDEIF